MPGRSMVWLGTLAFLAVGCLIGDDPCGKNQHRIRDGYQEGCVCDEGTVPNEDGIGCRSCGRHEVVRGGMCVCESGHARANAAAECLPEDELEPDGGAADPDGGGEEPGEPGTRGQDMSCTSSSECAGLDATYCLTLQTPNRCLVQSCADGTRRCASDRDCCVITVLPELAATGGLCVAKGTCMAPGMVVDP